MINNDLEITSYGSSKYNIDYDEVFIYEKKQSIRAQTAPARPPNDIDEFKKSELFSLIEKSLNFLEGFTHPYEKQFDVDSIEGQASCKNFLIILEKMHYCLNTFTSSRDYRTSFSKAYRILYKENKLCYLTEILDSAQEAVPCLYVNGEKYDFTINVIEKGNELFSQFLSLKKLIRKCFLSTNYENSLLDVSSIKNDLKECLEKFDEKWIFYENLYVKELMVIESQARKYITEAIELEKKLTELEKKIEKEENILNSKEDDLHNIKAKLVEKIAKINSIANVEGHGRDDLNYNILKSAEEIFRRISICESQSIRNLAHNVKNSFNDIRMILKKYSINIEVVDPQLRNNQDLVKILTDYEKFWESGKVYFLNKKKCSQLIFFSSVLEGLSEKYKNFAEMIECCEAEIFIIIPMIIVLRRINFEDQNICQHFLPELNDKNSNSYKMFFKLKNLLINLDKKNMKSNKENNVSNNFKFNNKKKNSYKILLNFNKGFIHNKISNQVYNFVENLIIRQDIALSKNIKYKLEFCDDKIINEVLRILRRLSIEVQRKNPSEWNEFLNVSLKNSTSVN